MDIGQSQRDRAVRSPPHEKGRNQGQLPRAAEHDAGLLEEEAQNGIRRPGACHRATSWQRGLYCLKLPIPLPTAAEESGDLRYHRTPETGQEAFEQLCIFFVSVYVRHWFQAPYIADSPINDLLLLKEIIAYGQPVDAVVAGIRWKK